MNMEVKGYIDFIKEAEAQDNKPIQKRKVLKANTTKEISHDNGKTWHQLNDNYELKNYEIKKKRFKKLTYNF